MTETPPSPPGYTRPAWMVGSVDPYAVLDLVYTQQPPGWSAAWGGPLGVARTASEAQDVLSAQMQTVARLRAAAIQEALETRSLAEVARELGISRQAVHQAARGIATRPATW